MAANRLTSGAPPSAADSASRKQEAARGRLLCAGQTPYFEAAEAAAVAADAESIADEAAAIAEVAAEEAEAADESVVVAGADIVAGGGVVVVVVVVSSFLLQAAKDTAAASVTIINAVFMFLLDLGFGQFIRVPSCEEPRRQGQGRSKGNPTPNPRL